MIRNRQELIALLWRWYWIQGWSLAEIGRRLSLSPFVVWSLFRQFQIPRRSQGGANNPHGRIDKQIRWQGQVTTVAALAKQHGKYPSTVYKRLRRGLSLREALQ